MANTVDPTFVLLLNHSGQYAETLGEALYGSRGHSMYGMVIQGAQDLLIHLGGEELWARVLADAGLGGSVFVATVTYDDSVVYRLVSSAAEVTGLSEKEVLTALGRHWILFTGRSGWGHMFDMAGGDLRSFIQGLDAMHMRLQAAMTEMKAPSFTCEPISDNQVKVIYRSERMGLAPMVTGILEGLAEMFDEQWDISHVEERTATSPDAFLLTERVPATSVSRTGSTP